MLSGDRPTRPTGNQLLAELFGAQLHYVGCPPNHWGELEIAREQLTDELAAGGAAPHSIPIGGSTATGALGYLVAYVELVEQCRRARPAPGGRRAHVVERRHPRRARGRAGAAARRSATTTCPMCWPIGVAKGVVAGVPDVRSPGRRRAGADRVGRRGRRRRRRDRRPLARPRLRRADARPATRRIRWAAVHGGWVLDRTYTGKGFAGLLGNAADRPLGPRRRGRVRPHRRPAGRLRRRLIGVRGRRWRRRPGDRRPGPA